jgi:hypothetical protein
MALKPLPLPDNPFVFIVIDPAAGGPQSDYAVVSIMRERGNVTVSPARASSRHLPRVLAPRREADRVARLGADELGDHVPAQVHEEVGTLALLRRLYIEQRLLEPGVDVQQQEEKREGVGKRQQRHALAQVADHGQVWRDVVLVAYAGQAVRAVALQMLVVHWEQQPRDELWLAGHGLVRARAGR